MRQSLVLGGLLLASPLAAQTPADLAAVTAQTPAHSCLSGDCKDGIGTRLLTNTAAERRFYTGHFAGGETAGEGADSGYELAPPDPTDPVAGPHYRLVRRVSGQWEPGYRLRPDFMSQFRLANTVRHDTLDHTELRLVNGLQTGTSCYWPQGSAQGSYVRETGRFEKQLFEQGTVELHGFRTLPTPTVRVEVKSGSGYRYYLRECVQGNCADGTGVLLQPGRIQAGTFRKYNLQKGTVEVYYAPLFELEQGLITLVGKFDAQGRAAARFVPDGTSDVIEGSVGQANYKFEPAPRYFFNDAAGLTHVHDEAPAWLRNVYGPMVLAASRRMQAERVRAEAAQAEKARQARLAQQAYDAAHPEVVAAREAAARREAAAARERPTRERTPHSVTSYCSSCGGSGYQDSVDYHSGSRTHEHCRACGGTGKTTVTY